MKRKGILVFLVLCFLTVIASTAFAAPSVKADKGSQKSKGNVGILGSWMSDGIMD